MKKEVGESNGVKIRLQVTPNPISSSTNRPTGTHLLIPTAQRQSLIAGLGKTSINYLPLTTRRKIEFYSDENYQAPWSPSGQG